MQGAETAVQRAAGPLPAGTARWLTLFAEPDRSAIYTVAPAGASGWYEAYVDPYRGEVLIVRDMLWDPIGVILRAHQSLLLPAAVGRRIVGLTVLAFVPSLLTGLFPWFPRRPAEIVRTSALRQRLTIDLRGRPFRVTYDLHRVLGGYALVVTLTLALTGLTWSFAWMDRAVYWVATGGQAPAERAGWKSAPPAAGTLTYDIHVGRIAGLGGRVAAFLASLVAASLPVTGALIWWNRR